MKALNSKIERPDREVLARAYEAGSCRSLAAEFGVSTGTIFKWLRQYGIPRRGGNGRWALKWDRCRNPECGTDERPHKALGYCERCYRRLVQYPREKSGQTSGKPVYTFNCITLARRYWDEGLSHRALAREYEVSEGTIRRAFIRCQIASRPRGGARFVRGRDGWAKEYDHCVKCGTDEVPHKAHGLCEKCHERKKREELKRAARPRVRRMRLKVRRKQATKRTLVYVCQRCGYEHYEEAVSG